MKPHFIFIIRHGESMGNVDKNIYKTVPDWKVPLTDQGIKQAKEAGYKLSQQIFIKNYKLFHPSYYPLQIYSSPWYRARQTAENIKLSICETLKIGNIIIREDPRIREQEWGNFQEEHLVKKIKDERYRYGSFFYRMPHGESGADVYDRVTTFIDTLHRDFKKENFPDNMCIVTHGLTLKIFLMRWFHWTIEEFEKYDTPENCHFIRMNLHDNKYQLINNLPLRND